MDLLDFLGRQTFVNVAPCRLRFGRPRVLLERLTFGRKPDVQLRDLISIVSYQIFVRWIREKEASDAKELSQDKFPVFI
jgi:hypothetical protein